MGRALESDIPLPSSESETKELIQSLEIEIKLLLEEKRRKEARDMEDMQKAQELQKKLNEGSSQHLPPPVSKDALPPNPNADVIKIMKEIKNTYNDNIDYNTADAFLMQADRKVPKALEEYKKTCLLNVTLIHNGKNHSKRFSTFTKGEDFLNHIYDDFKIPKNHVIFVYKENYEGNPFDSSMMHGKTLGDLGILDKMALYLLSS